MSMPAALLPRGSTEDERGAPGEGLSLAALLELLADPRDPATTRSRPGRRPKRLRQVGLRLRTWSRRAAGWGAGPQGAWRAW